MKLATFIAPGGTAAQAGEVRGDEIVAFTPAPSSTASRPATARPPTGAGLRARPTSRCWSRSRARRRSSASAATTPRTSPSSAPSSPRSRSCSSSCRSRASRRAARSSARRPTRRSTTRPSWSLVMGAGNEIAGYAVANDVSARDLQRSRGAVVARQGLRHLLPVGPVDHDRRRAAGRRRPAHHHPRQRRAAPGRQHERPDLQARRSSSTSSREACTLEPGAIILTGTPSGVGEAFNPPQYLQPGDTVRVEIEGLGARSSTPSRASACG